MNQSAFQQSLATLSTVVALVAAFLLSPQAHDWSVGWILSLSVGLYGHGDWIAVAPYVWWGVVAISLFALTRLLLSALFSLLGFGVASRMR